MTTENTRNYTFGINVERAEELDAIGPKVKRFMDVLGDGPADIQVAINPGLGDTSAPEQLTPAIGFVTDSAQYYEDYETEDDDIDE